MIDGDIRWVTMKDKLTKDELERLKELKARGWWRFVTGNMDDGDVQLLTKVINSVLED